MSHNHKHFKHICIHRLKISPISQEEIKRIGVCHSSLLTIGQERLADLADLFSSVFQPIYFVNVHFLLATNYFISS